MRVPTSHVKPPGRLGVPRAIINMGLRGATDLAISEVERNASTTTIAEIATSPRILVSGAVLVE